MHDSQPTDADRQGTDAEGNNNNNAQDDDDEDMEAIGLQQLPPLPEEVEWANDDLEKTFDGLPAISLKFIERCDKIVFKQFANNYYQCLGDPTKWSSFIPADLKSMFFATTIALEMAFNTFLMFFAPCENSF